MGQDHPMTKDDVSAVFSTIEAVSGVCFMPLVEAGRASDGGTAPTSTGTGASSGSGAASACVRS